MQIISDLENKEGSVFPQDVLKDIILSYNNTAQKFMPDLLSKTFEAFRQQQENFLKAFNAEDQHNKLKKENADFFEEWQKSQTDIMEKIMQPWIKNPMFNAKKDEQSSDPEATKNDEIDVLRQQIDELRDIITKKNT